MRVRRAWLDAATIIEGAVFRNVDRHGSLRGERLVKRVRLAAKVLAGLSLRAVFASSAARAGHSALVAIDVDALEDARGRAGRGGRSTHSQARLGARGLGHIGRDMAIDSEGELATARSAWKLVVPLGAAAATSSHA